MRTLIVEDEPRIAPIWNGAEGGGLPGRDGWRNRGAHASRPARRAAAGQLAADHRRPASATPGRRHVDRELARACLRSGRDAQSAEPGRIATRLIGVLRRTPLGAGIDWQFSAPPRPCRPHRPRRTDRGARRVAGKRHAPCAPFASRPAARPAASSSLSGTTGRAFPRRIWNGSSSAASASIPAVRGRVSAWPWSPRSSMPRRGNCGCATPVPASGPNCISTRQRPIPRARRFHRFADTHEAGAPGAVLAR